MTDIALYQSMQQSIDDVAGQLSESSKRIYLIDAKHFGIWMQEQQLTPATFTRSHMIAYRSYLDTAISPWTNKRYSKAAKQRMFVVASRLMNEQHLKGNTPEDVTNEVKGFKTGKNETTHIALSKQQAKDMLGSIDQSTTQGKRDYTLLLLLTKTGLRRSEAVALNRGNITMLDGHHVAIVEHGKGDKTRVVKLRVDVVRAITAYLQALPGPADADSPLFVRIRRGDHPTGERLTDKAVELIVRKHAPEGIDTTKLDLTPHGLRATFATIALEQGAPLHQVQYAMGHEDPRTTERYQKRKLNLDNNAVDYLNF
jgi:site-specific recombinase XerD